MSVSFWLSDDADDERAKTPLSGTTEADVCIVGGGFTGLWTAYELKRAEPGLDVVLIERRHCGFGASGRNGGWVVGELSGSRERWAARAGKAGVEALDRAIRDTVVEVGRVVEAERIECDFVAGGSLAVAQSAVELDRLRDLVAARREWGIGPDHCRMLDEAEARSRLAVRDVKGAVFTPDCARVHPGNLVRGLARLARERGVRVYESTPAAAIEPGLVRTPRGDVRAPRIVRATEAYTAGLPGQRRVLAPINSSMIVTEPLAPEVWDRVGWENFETVLDGQRRYHYLQRTADGRIAIGGRGNPYRYGSGTGREDPVPGRTVEGLRDRLASLFGREVGDAPIAAAWHGVLGVPRDWQPRVWFDRASGIGWAGGYAGEGVAAANLAGRTLRDLLLERETELTSLPWVEPAGPAWEREPLRYVGIQAVYRSLGVADRMEQARGRRSWVAGLADRLAGKVG